MCFGGFSSKFLLTLMTDWIVRSSESLVKTITLFPDLLRGKVICLGLGNTIKKGLLLHLVLYGALPRMDLEE